MATVLVVDDEPLIRTMMALILQQEGFSVLTADGGPEAISVSQSHAGAIDLLVTDVVMPGMDGPTLAAKLQKDDPGMSVLLMSGYCESAQLDRCKQFDLLPKPFAMCDLLVKVHSLLRDDVLQVVA